MVDVLLGYSSFPHYLKDQDYFNALVGRVSNRIGGGLFELGGTQYQLSQNEGNNHLHGGCAGLDSKVWDLLELINSPTAVGCRLGLESEHLEEGYPGHLKIEASYMLYENNSLILKIRAFSDRDTILSITNHNYWNFNGHGEFYSDISNHILQIPSKLVCTTDVNQIPTGELQAIDETMADFQSPRFISQSLLKEGGLDLNYCFEGEEEIHPRAEVYSPCTGLGVLISSDLPGMQCYTGGSMKDFYPGKQQRSYGKNFGICLEPQHYPNAINQPGFPSPVLRAGATYEKTIRMDFRRDYPRTPRQIRA